MVTTIPATVVQCVWCDHTEAGDGFAPHDAILTHQAEVHGRRKMPCGCAYVPNDSRDPGSPFHWWTCDEHSVPLIRQTTAWQLANYAARRWAAPEPAQPSLFAGASS